MTIAVPETPSRRIAIFDGIRGVAIILVVLSHLWHVSPWMLQRMYDVGDGTGAVWSQALGYAFTAGNFAVSIFFVVGSFLATRAMLRQVGSPRGFRPGVNIARRFIRLAGQLYFMLLVLLVVTAVDSTRTYDESTTRGSVLSAATFTWNWYVHDHLDVARPDIGHLWYLAVDFQIFLLVVAAVWLLRRRPAVLVVVLGALWVALLFWRVDIFAYDPNGALLRTWARGDAPVAGALAAAALPFLGGLTKHARALAVGGAVSLVPLLFLSRGTEAFFGWPGLTVDIALAVFVVGCTMTTPPAGLVAALGNRPLAFLGRHSLSIYLWHFTVFTFVARHTTDWRELPRVVVALALATVAVLISELLVERRVQRFLDSPRWVATDDGLGRFLVRAVTARTSRVTSGRRRESDKAAAVTEEL